MELADLLSIGSRSIIALSGILVIIGVILIKSGKKDLHKRVMISATVLALVFVVLYVIKSSLFPFGKYTGEYRSIFLAILTSHTILSVLNIPAVIITIYHAFKGNFEKHKRIAPYTAALWVYVALSGWLVYYMNS